MEFPTVIYSRYKDPSNGARWKKGTKDIDETKTKLQKERAGDSNALAENGQLIFSIFSGQIIEIDPGPL